MDHLKKCKHCVCTRTENLLFFVFFRCNGWIGYILTVDCYLWVQYLREALEGSTTILFLFSDVMGLLVWTTNIIYQIHRLILEPILTTVDCLWRKFRWCNKSKSGDFIHCVHAFSPPNLLKKYNFSNTHVVCAFSSVYVHLSMCILYHLSRGL